MKRRLDSQQKQPIGDRFRHARSLVPLSRTAFCRKHAISYHTMQSWELARHASRLKNIIRFCEALAKEGIICTEKWLLEGVGPFPLSANILNQPETLTLVAKEMTFFQELHLQAGRQTVVMHVQDDAMAPDYQRDDYIGAQSIPLAEEEKLYNQICLIEVEPQNYMLRQFLKEGKRYLLLAHKNIEYPPISLDKIVGLGEILIRRRLPAVTT